MISGILADRCYVKRAHDTGQVLVRKSNDPGGDVHIEDVISQLNTTEFFGGAVSFLVAAASSAVSQFTGVASEIATSLLCVIHCWSWRSC